MAAQQGRPPEVAEILRSYAPALDCLGADRRRAVRDITSCRTVALGGHLHKCDACGHEVPLYNSCRNRHCPKCQNLEQARWVEQQVRDLLPVHYFHVVFTVPACLQPLFVKDRRLSYALLFAAAWETLREVCRSQLGATPGMIAVLHTWSQTLVFHPHVHCIATGGGIDPSGERWVSSHPGYFLPVRVLSRVFRAKLLQALEGSMESACRARGMAILREAVSQPWVVYRKPPMAGPQLYRRVTGREPDRCPACGRGRLSIVATFAPARVVESGRGP